jgi:prefoldin subunit 5
MDELREAVRALAAEAQRIERQLEICADPPSKSELEALQKGVDGIQQRLNRLQTAMDAWSEESEAV